VVSGLDLWIAEHNRSVTDVCFSPDNNKIVSASNDSTIKVWNINTGSLLWTGKHSSQVKDVDFSPDGQKMASGSYAGDLTVWDSDGHWIVSD